MTGERQRRQAASRGLRAASQRPTGSNARPALLTATRSRAGGAAVKRRKPRQRQPHAKPPSLAAGAGRKTATRRFRTAGCGFPIEGRAGGRQRYRTVACPAAAPAGAREDGKRNFLVPTVRSVRPGEARGPPVASVLFTMTYDFASAACAASPPRRHASAGPGAAPERFDRCAISVTLPVTRGDG